MSLVIKILIIHCFFFKIKHRTLKKLNLNKLNTNGVEAWGSVIPKSIIYLFICLFYKKKQVMVINSINNNGNNSQNLLRLSHTPGTLLSGF